MTIAISIKVNDGVVLAADSASTLMQHSQDGQISVLQVYNNANKVFNLRKGLPIGLITWGAGSIGQASISTLLKDLRMRLSGEDPEHQDWHIDHAKYQVKAVSDLVKKFIYDEHYVEVFKEWPQKPVLGFVIAGYSAGAHLAEEFVLQIGENGKCNGPRPLQGVQDCGASWWGEPEAISRLILGFSPTMAHVLQKRLGVPQKEVPAAIDVMRNSLAASLVKDPMPIQDVIDLAEFLVHVTEGFSRYTDGATTVGGPIEIASITKHEGFKWIKRKHYFNNEMNPEVPS